MVVQRPTVKQGNTLQEKTECGTVEHAVTTAVLCPFFSTILAAQTEH
jgi:hypothetical protein